MVRRGAGERAVLRRAVVRRVEVGGLELGATGSGGVQDVGEGIRVATVLDPSGNVFGIIENLHFALEGA